MTPTILLSSYRASLKEISHSPVFASVYVRPFDISGALSTAAKYQGLIIATYPGGGV